MQKISWRSPSNIALVKYWGKKGEQLPMNPSISFGLEQSFTETSLSYQKHEQKGISLDFLFEGKENQAFAARLQKYLNRMVEFIPSLEGIHLVIESQNSFPHSSGIASSASAMSALALCLVTFEEQFTGTPFTQDAFYQKASYLARLGSGSAARSVYPGYSLWGKTTAVTSSSDLYAVNINSQVQPIFKNYGDAILLVSRSEKKVSSSLGHQLMENHPFAKAKFDQAFKNTESMLSILKSGDTQAFIALIESEALALHAMMMTSNPAFILMEPNTLSILQKIQDFRQQTGLSVGFTLDAGANVHFLYPKMANERVLDFIQQELLMHCENKQWVDDKVGSGPVKLEK